MELDQLEQFETQVESLLSLEQNEELEALKNDLKDAIELMRTQRFEGQSNARKSEIDTEIFKSNEELKEESNEESNEVNQHHVNSYNQLIGESYRVPFVNNGNLELHEAEILRLIEIEDEDKDAKLEVKFLYPLNKSMKYCSKCSTDNSSCPFNHGYSVNLSMINNSLDLNDLKLNSKCLYKSIQNNPDDLWRKGTIVNRKSEDDLFCVRPESTQELLSVKLENIYPFDDYQIDNHEVSLIGENQEEINQINEDNIPKSNDVQEFAEWHSNGFGSKILEKLGHIPGKGLGKNQQGIVHPIRFSILPSNTSLDVCMELKKKGLLSNNLDKFSHEKQKNYFKNLILKKNLKLSNEKDDNKFEDKNKLFDTLNKNLATKSKVKEPKSVYSKLKLIQRETKNVDNVHINIFKIEAEIKKLKNDIQHVKKSISLCREMNPANLSKLRETLSSKTNELYTNELKLKALKAKKSRDKYNQNVKYF